MILQRLRQLVPLLLVLPSSAALAGPPAVPLLPLAEIRAGQKAEVRTVFAGSRIESFEAEIVGVFHGGRTEGDMILARATSERVKREGIAQGMSGSPVYVEGKLVGALSSGWQFSREPLFGITPIAEMMRVLDLPALPGDEGSAGVNGVEPSGMATGVRFRELRWSDDEPATAPAAPPVPGLEGLRPLAVPLACGGLDPAALEAARECLAPLGLAVVPGGHAPSGGPAADSMAAGSAVAVDLMRGDMQMSAIGTVTYRDGDRLLIFGHPFFQAGNVRMPMSSAEIVTIVSSEVSSFKLGMPGRVVGAAMQDRRPAVAGVLGASARMLPVTVAVSTPERPRQIFHFESIEDRTMAPSLVGVAALNSLLESGGTGAGQTLRWTLRLRRPGAPPLVLSDIAAGDAASNALLGGISAPLRFLLNNPFERPRLDSLTVEIDARPGREQFTLRSARLLEAAVRPGGALHVRCSLERWRGSSVDRDFTLSVPEEMPPGSYLLWIGGGDELTHFEATRLPGRFRPTSFDDAWNRLAHTRSSEALYAALVAQAPEITSDGRDYPELPLSAWMLLGSPLSAGERGRPGNSALLDETRLAVKGLVRGEIQLRVTVDAAAP